mmetsp:Transcript_95305/g.242167  ORF Transcript_95305/g.242167 Transcript_95305/m.242167 type:complete len:90 (+) Transcript_95305:758-1027(+)
MASSTPRGPGETPAAFGVGSAEWHGDDTSFTEDALLLAAPRVANSSALDASIVEGFGNVSSAASEHLRLARRRLGVRTERRAGKGDAGT